MRMRYAAAVIGISLVPWLSAPRHAEGRPEHRRETAPALSQIRPEPNRGGTVDLASTDIKVARDRLKPAEGYEIGLFASEKEFPEIANPLAMTFDTRGRLWVLTSPTYPHVLPGVPPHDKLVILDDVNLDGRADKLTVFADGLYIPTGFELGDGGAYVSQQPNLVFLRESHIAVDFITERFPPRVQAAVHAVSALLGVALLAAILWYSWQQAAIQVRQGDRSVTLGIPMAFYWGPLLLGTALSIAASFFVFIKAIIRLRK